eukprot:TRINITY_DN4889_c1_g1_i1.p1 TRINITY_DN4889_c1_g1~~TRINITY_DN4889_c1_g1_i1.p1  ORF type:complete len:337 (+),score=84.85 TRINITY_DN4889_c1_g1_i1:79-1011(+)
MRGALAAAAVLLAALLWRSRAGREGPLHPGRRVVVITGATQGLGRAAAELFARRGDRVFACGRNADRLAELRLLPNVTALRCDVADEGSVGELAAAVRQGLRPGEAVDCVVNNAGVLLVGHPMLAARTAAFDLSWGVNVRGPFLVSRALVPLMVPRADAPAPVIINLGSTTETPKIAQAFHGLYQMSKVALLAFSTAIRQEAALKGVRVAHIRAGAFDTALHTAFHEAAQTLKGYGADYAGLAPRVQNHLTENLKLVTSAPVSELAELLWRVAHSSAPLDSYDFNVSWLEALVEWLPQWVLDATVAKAYQ